MNLEKSIIPKVEYLSLKLPLTTLHIMRAGKGKPLIIVPATISELDNWKDLVQFMAQKYQVYFFELPGHGKSTPFNKPFNLSLVSQTVEDLIDELNFKKFTLMGFSFGGILTLNTLKKLNNKIIKLILIAPCVSHSAIKYSRYRMVIVKLIHRIIKIPNIKNKLFDIMHNEKYVFLIIQLINHIGKIEKNIRLKNKLLTLPSSTLDVIFGQIKEILNADFSDIGNYRQPTFFAMSVNDPILDFNKTVNFMKKHFKNLTVKKSYVHYHQPPKPYSFKYLNRNYKDLLKNL